MTMEQYLEEVAKGLAGLPLQERQDILLEIESHIHETVSRGETLETVLRRLGPSKILAQSYAQSHALHQGKITFGQVLSGFGFYSAAALSAIMVVPTLSICAVVFAVTALAVAAGGIISGLGIFVFPFSFGLWQVTGIAQIAVAVVVGGLLLLLARLCWKGLMGYLRGITAGYHKRRMR